MKITRFNECEGMALSGGEMPNGQSALIRCQSGKERHRREAGENFSILWICNVLDYD
jgi:hypothetical protein